MFLKWNSWMSPISWNQVFHRSKCGKLWVKIIAIILKREEINRYVTGVVAGRVRRERCKPYILRWFNRLELMMKHEEWWRTRKHRWSKSLSLSWTKVSSVLTWIFITLRCILMSMLFLQDVFLIYAFSILQGGVIEIMAMEILNLLTMAQKCLLSCLNI